MTSGRRFLAHGTRNTLLAVHIMVSVGLLGDSAGFLAVAMRAAAAGDAETARQLVEVLQMFAFVFGIPLSFAALISGIALGLGTKWGVFRYPWVVTKLALIISVIAVGGLMISPAFTDMLERGVDSTSRLIAAAAYDVVALAVATGLGVFKPGARFGTSSTLK
jgi:hypothetical protein